MQACFCTPDRTTTVTTDRQKDLIAAAYRALATLLPGFKPRRQQQQMVQRVSGVLSQEAIGLIEAPTGTGKSVGYLLPGIVAAVEQDKVLVVSTATASLQDQLATKDLPLVLRALDLAGISGVTWAVAKGRERHLCPAKLEQETQTTDLFRQGDQPILEKLRDQWDGDAWDGVRDTLPERVDRATWMRIANTSAGCTGERCPHYEGCPYYAAIARAKSARVIITNHDYLLATFANIDNSFLCDTERNLFVFDEAHHLSDKILSAFATSLDLAIDHQDQIKRIEKLIGSYSGVPLDIAGARLQAMWSATANATLAMLGDGTQHRFTLGEAPPSYVELLGELRASIGNMTDLLTKAMDSMTARGRANGGKRSHLNLIASGLIGQLKGDLADAVCAIDEFTSPDNDRARWLARGRTSIEIRSSPFDSGAKARKHLWPRIQSAVLTSATLSTLGGFEATKAQLGLPKDTPALRLDSPLDYSNARFVVPALAADAGTPAHGAMVKAFVREQAVHSQERGVLVYFTSRALMTETYRALEASERDVVLLQGDWQPSAMVEEHKRRIDAGQRSVLFGLDSLSEGVDLPGDYCTLVLVTRLPFPPPNDPVLATHAEHLKRKGLHAFNLLMLPKAGLKLAQVCGRLIRTDGDHGAIICLDNRVRSRQYGHRLLASTSFRAIVSR
jgi:ATP-dependent DNA helicase DinG